LQYVVKSTGEEILQFRKAWERNDDGCLDIVMEDMSNYEEPVPVQEEEIIEDINSEVIDNEVMEEMDES